MDRREFLSGAAAITASAACGHTLPLLHAPSKDEVDLGGTFSVDGSTLSLDSGWKFKSGDDLNWAEPDLDDKDWVGVRPYYPLNLQNIDSRGYGWYRVVFALPPEWRAKSEKLYLYLGRINNADQTFLNGQTLSENGELLKPGTSPSNTLAGADNTASMIRNYVLSADDQRLNWSGDNVLAIRVFAEKEDGGLDPGIRLLSIADPSKTYSMGWEEEYPIPRDPGTHLEMPANWKVQSGDDLRWRTPEFDDSHWDTGNPSEIRRRDTATWFRSDLVIPSSLISDRYFRDEIVFDFGRVHDKVEFYLNGISLEEYRIPSRDIEKYYPTALKCEYVVPVDSACIKWDRANLLAVRLYNHHDWWGAGFKGGRLFVANFFDLVDITFNRIPYEIQARMPISINFNAITRSHKRKIDATLEYKVYDRQTREVSDSSSSDIEIFNDRDNNYRYSFLPMTNADYLLWYKVTEKKTECNFVRERLLGYERPAKELRFSGQPIHWDQAPFDKADVSVLIENKVKDQLIPTHTGGQRIAGLFAQPMRINSDKALWGFIEDFEIELLEGFYDRPKKGLAQGEFLGKYVHGMVLDLRYKYNDELKLRLDRLIDVLIGSVDSDGYSGTNISPARWLNFDVWEQKYNLYALLYYYGFTGYQPALDAAKKIGDLLCSTFGEEPGKLNIIKTSHHMGMVSTSVLDPMVLLYRYTGNRTYFNFCAHIVEMWERPYGPKLISEMLATKSFAKTGDSKSYEQTSCYIGLLHYYQLVGDERYRKVLENAFTDLADNRTYITGSNSEAETVRQFITNGDIATWPCESCATAHWMQFCIAMFYLTGELRYMEEIERTTYNHLLASENPHSGAICYYSPLQNEKPFSYGIACCNSSLPRVIAMIPEILWAKFASGGIAIFIYNQGRMGDFIQTTNGKTVFVDLHIKSDYPKSGRVSISVNPTDPAEFKLALRVPQWTPEFNVTLDGTTLSGQPGKYVNLTRSWSRGDCIEISIEMNDHVVQGQSLAEEMKKEEWHSVKNCEFFEKYGNFANSFAIKHGPQVLAIDGFLSKLDNAGQVTLDVEQPLKLQPVDDVLPNGWVGNQAYFLSALKSPAGEPVIVVPFSDAGQTGGDIRVWIEKS